MLELDAFATEDRSVDRAIKVLDTFLVLLTQFLLKEFLILVFEVKSGLGQNWVLFNHLVQNVDVEWKSLGRL